MSILDNLSISRKQARSIALANADASKSQINFWPGAVRSGKTIGSLVKFEMKLADGADLSGENVIISRTRDTAYRNLIAPMQDAKLFGHYAEYVKYNRGAPTAEIFGEMVHVIGASDVRAEATIRGMTIKRSYVDEWTLIAKDFTNMLISRHSVAGAWCGGTSNPNGPQHYLKKEYMDVAAERGHQVFPFEIEDNRANLPDGYIENLSAQYTGLWHDRFIKGLWTMADGVVYESFDPAIHVVDSLPEMHRILCVGIDYGDTNPTRGILLGLGVDNRLYAMAEWAPGKGTTADRSASLAAFLDAYPTWEFLFVDPAAAGFKFQLNRDQFPNVANAANRVDDGIKVVSSLFTTRQLLIHESCTNLLQEIPGYVWDDKQSKKGHDAPIKVDDHACFVAGTPVETEGGPVPIESVTAGMRVHTRDGLRTVTAQSMTSPDAQVYDVHMSDGTTLTGTGNHPVWVHGHGWIRLDALRYSDRLEAGGRSASTSTGQPGAAPVHVLDVCEAGRSAVYNLTVGGTPEYFASGVLVHNCDALRYAVATSRPFWQPYLPNLDAVTRLPDERIEAAA